MVGINPGDLLDRYRVERVLASGGFGTVVRARHVHLGSGHALKVLHVFGELERDRLLREARIQAVLRHPGIVAVTDVVPLEVGIATVMELVDGPNLHTWASRHRPTAAEVDWIAEQIFAAMAYAHSAGVIHRDLKPDNVLVERRGRELLFRVTDFGLAVRDTEPTERVTRTGQAMGTPGYMAPEQFRDARSVDARADVYALGAIFYELFAGRTPSTASSLVEAYAAAEAGEHPALATVAPEAPGRMCEAIEASLRPDPAGRPESVAELHRIWRGAVPAPAPRWAEDALAAAEPPPDETSHPNIPTLAPTTGAPPPAQHAQASVSVPDRRSGRWFALVAGTAILAVATGLGISALVIWAWPRPEPAVEPVPVEPVVVELAPVEPEPEPIPAPTPVQVKAEPVTKPAPEKVEAAAPAQATVRVLGANRPRLVSTSGRSWPASSSVPPGSYALEVTFGDGAPTRVMTFDVGAGETRIIKCTASLRVCE